MVFVGASRSMAMSAKARIPSIKFRYGCNAGIQTAATGATAMKQGASASQAHPNAAQGTTYTTQLPARFMRQPISEEEIAYINRGGPD